jgi:hypothetical protein
VYAKTLVKKRAQHVDDGEEESEESWTFIGDDGDPELVRRIAEFEPKPRMRHEPHEGESSPNKSHPSEPSPTKSNAGVL